jgi:hypothetical protein
MTPYSVINIKKNASKLNHNSYIDSDGQDSDNEEELEEDEDITRDAMIKVVSYLDSLSYFTNNSISPVFPITSARMHFLFPTFIDSYMASI